MTIARLQHRRALDGVRALAIVGVACFHFHVQGGHAVPGGYFGVDVFFVLSGFLITVLFVQEHATTGGLALGRFYRRRLLRLLPALAFFLVGWLVAVALFGHDSRFNLDPFGPRNVGTPQPLGQAWRDAVLSFTCIVNWWKVLHRSVALQLGHLWYVAVQEQVYLVWPALLLVVLARRRGTTLALALALVLAVASFLWSLLLWHGGRGADHVYFGTDSRAQGLLLGAVAGLLWARGSIGRLPRAGRGLLAAAGGAVLIAMFLRYAGDVIKFRGGFALAAVATACVVTWLVDAERGIAVAVLGCAPLVWLGRRSYAVYLWHYPFACWTHRLSPAVGVPLGMGATLAAAELSWLLVESRAERRRPRATPRPSVAVVGS